MAKPKSKCLRCGRPITKYRKDDVIIGVGWKSVGMCSIEKGFHAASIPEICKPCEIEFRHWWLLGSRE